MLLLVDFDIFVLKLNSSGTFQWVKTYAGDHVDYPYAIAVDSSSNVYITGYFVSSDIDFGSGSLNSGAGSKLFVLKLNSSGTFQWVNTSSSPNSPGYDITVDSSSNVYITGSFDFTVDFGGGDVTPAGGNDIFVLKLNSSGGGIE